jgi:DNA-binding transcriptional LysR family regulator
MRGAAMQLNLARAPETGRARIETARPRSAPDRVTRWPGIELRHLDALAVVADEGSFHGAARRLGYTQSAVSQQIAVLERAVGHSVLERPSRGRPLALTPVGARLCRLRHTLDDAIGSARADVDALAAGVADIVRVAVSFPLPRLASAVVEMRARRPGVVVEIVSADGDRLLRLVETGAVDIAVVGATAAGRLEVLRTVSSPYVAAVPSLSRLARIRRLFLADLAEYPRISTADGTAFAEDVVAAVVARDAEMAVELVAGGVGVAVLPAVLATPRAARVTMHPLRDGLPPFRLAVVTAKEATVPAAELAQLLATDES